MITFTIALVVLVLGYVFYGRYLARLLDVNPQNVTPAVSKADGVDYVPMPTWKIFMIQFLNIAGLGPIFGAIMGAKFGTSSYLWIVLGTIFAGAMHDFVSAMISVRSGGQSLPQIIGSYLGNIIQKIMVVFSIILMVLVGVTFISQPAAILDKITPDFFNLYFWIVVIFLYYLLATMFPIDKIIGKVYPLFAFVLLFMAFGIMVVLFVRWPDLPEMWNGFGTKYMDSHSPIFPMMFISIACGAISGFHATQSPMMARCIKNEKYGRPVFYGAMVAEGIVALVWAAAATSYYNEFGASQQPADIVMAISKSWLGPLGGFLAILGVIAAPITSGDTALRAARIIIADGLHMQQKKISSRLVISLPLFAITAIALIFTLSDSNGFDVVWRYFSWCNQQLSVFTLWTITVFLALNKKNYIISLIPAIFMTMVTITYILQFPAGKYIEGVGLNGNVAIILAGTITIVCVCLFMNWISKVKKNSI